MPDLVQPPARVAQVLVCDDSLVMRAAIARTFEADPAVRVAARAGNGAEALERIAAQAIDVAVLDIEMPVLDGLATLPRLLRAAPGLRVLMASTLTTRGAEITIRALRLGAADYIAKPSALAPDSAGAFAGELLAKVKALAGIAERHAGALAVASHIRPPPSCPPRLLAIGCSTGGPQALLELVRGLGGRVPVPVIVTQHMPAAFTPLLAEHLARAGELPCAEARDQEVLLPGRIYVAPGERHLLVARANESLHARLSDTPAENFCRPSVDPMLRSASAACNGQILIAMLTGMGHDGLAGAQEAVAAGATLVAQDAATSIVWGMPGAVAKAGLCHAVLPLPRIAPKLLELLRVTR